MRRFFRSEGGNVAVTGAIAMVPVMAGVVGAVDFVNIQNKASEIQNALDAAALAVATQHINGIAENLLFDIGEDHFRSNVGVDDKLIASFDLTLPGKETDGEIITAMAAAAGPVQFFSTESSFTYVGMIASSDLLRGYRKSTAQVSSGQEACVLALDKSASAAIKLQGSTNVELAGCVIAANSRASDAVSRGGNARLTAACAISSGGTSGIASNSNVKLDCDAPLEKQYPAADPFANFQMPPYTGCQFAKGGGNKGIELEAGKTYCDKSLSGKITLAPGTYIFRGTNIKLGGNGSLTGSGVTIFLMEGASISFGANEVVNLSPPESGPYAGITIYQAPGNASPLTLLGGLGTTITGYVYAPSAHIQYAGNSDMTGAGECIRIVGKTVEMTGNSNIALDCSSELGGREMYASRYIKIVR